MPSPESIAEAKIGIKVNSIPEHLAQEIRAITHANSAKGLLKSGATIRQVLAACQASMGGVSATAISELQWALDQTWVLTPHYLSQLNSIAQSQLQATKEICLPELRRIITLCGGEHAQSKVESDFESHYLAAVANVGLALEKKHHELKNQRIRNLFSQIASFIMSLRKSG